VRLAAALALAISVGCASDAELVAVHHAQEQIALLPLHPGNGDPAIACVTSEPGVTISGTTDARAVIVAVWADGTIIWSEDRSRGGPPYFLAELPAFGVQRLVSQMQSSLRASQRTEYLVPDAGYTEVALASPTRLDSMSSCIPEFERHPGLVATDDGIQALKGQDRAEVLARQSRELREFRDAWTRSVDALIGAIPESGIPLGLEAFRYAESLFRCGRARNSTRPIGSGS